MSGSPGQQLRAYVDYLRDMGIYDLYRRSEPSVEMTAALREMLTAGAALPATAKVDTGAREPERRTPVGEVSVARSVVAARPREGQDRSLAELSSISMVKPVPFDAMLPPPPAAIPAGERAAALAAVRAEIGDCTRCPLAYAGRRTIVFADGDPNAQLMFVGEGPGADEDASGLPFVGKAGQLLNNMIAAMGVTREQVYIANIVKCRPPANRTPEYVEASTCSQFLVQQIDIVRPQVIVALGATAATYLLGVKQPLASLRGRWHSCRGAKVAVTYHPAFLLRDPRQKGEAWKDLQRVMAELGLKAPARG
jgi:DNA polymerase